jgi:hypothetical protein
MTIEEVTNKLSFEMVILTGHPEDVSIYQQYIQIGIVLGMEYFKKDQQEVIALDDKGVIVGKFRSVTEASKKLGICRQGIVKVLNARAHSAGGLHFVKQKDWNR